MKITTFITKVMLLTIFFMVLIADLSYDSVVKALLFSIVTAAISYRFISPTPAIARFKFIFLYYILWLLKEILLSTISMSRIILFTPTSKIMPVINKISTRQQTTEGKTIFANSITLTPGTVAMFYDREKLNFHAMGRTQVLELKKSKIYHLISKSYR